MVKVTNEKTENSQAFLTIEMEPSEVEKSLEESYHRLVQKAKIPGFRKGKAPREILERYLGKDSLLEEALKSLAPQASEQAIKEQEIEAIAQPHIEVTQTDPVVFKTIVPLKPRVSLGDYQQIRIEPEPVELTEDKVSAVLEQLRHQHATWEPVERPVDFNDLVVMDVDSTIEDKPFINREGIQYQVIADLSFPAPGFGEQIAGMKKGEEKEFTLQLPEDHPDSELAGKEARFKIKVHEIKQEILPELNDDFARVVNPEFETMDILREKASSELKLRAEEKARADLEEKVLDAVVDLSEVEFPPVLEEIEVHRILDQRFQRGNQEMEEYLRSINKTEEELHEELHPLANKRVTRSLVLGKVMEEEKIAVNDPEIDAEIERVMRETTASTEEVEKVLQNTQARESVEQSLLTRKTMERLIEIASNSNETEIIQKEEGQ